MMEDAAAFAPIWEIIVLGGPVVAVLVVISILTLAVAI
jgi:hypothetical protein